LLREPLNALDQLVIEEGTRSDCVLPSCYMLWWRVDFLIRNEHADSTKQALWLIEMGLERAGELLGEVSSPFDPVESVSEKLKRTSISGSVSSSRSSSMGSISSQHIQTGVSASASLSRSSSGEPKASQALLKPPKPTGSVNADLSAVRKMHEKANLSKVIARQKQQEHDIVLLEKQKQAEKQRPSLINLQAISDLISRRQHVTAAVNERIQSLFESFAFGTGGTRAATVDEDIWRRTIKLSLTQQAQGDSTAMSAFSPIKPIVGLLKHKSHPVAKLVLDFTNRFRFNLQEVIVSKSELSLRRSIDEYHQFCYQLRKLILHNYGSAGMDAKGLDAQLQITLEHFFFGDMDRASLAALFRAAIASVNESSDVELNRKLIDIGWNADPELFELLELPQKYRLEPENRPVPDAMGSEPKVTAAITSLRSVSILQSPTAKATALIQTCELICQAFKSDSEDTGM
jgi:hypothetical protein